MNLKSRDHLICHPVFSRGMNLKLPFPGDRSAHLICHLSRNLSVWILSSQRVGIYQYESQIASYQNEFFGGGGRFAMWSATWSAWARVEIYQYESQIALSWEDRSATWALPELSEVDLPIYQYESQISIFWWGRSATWSSWALRVAIY